MPKAERLSTKDLVKMEIDAGVPGNFQEIDGSPKGPPWFGLMGSRAKRLVAEGWAIQTDKKKPWLLISPDQTTTLIVEENGVIFDLPNKLVVRSSSANNN